MDNYSRIYVAGHGGMLGSALVRLLTNKGFTNLILASSKELDLRDQHAVNIFFDKKKPEYVILCAAKTGGINANVKKPAEFLYDNLSIQNNVIHCAYKMGIKKIIFIGSSCIFPKESPQPMKEEYLLTGPLEPTNEGFALAKIIGVKMLENYYKQYGFESISLIPCNLYGPNDSFDPEKSSVFPALIKKISDAAANGLKEVTIWGTGIARREFMHVDDLAEAVLFFMSSTCNSGDFVNIGWGEEISIKKLVEMIVLVTGYKGNICWDSTKPNGMLHKCMDVTKMKTMGYFPIITLEQGIDEMVLLYNKQRNVAANSALKR